MRISRHRAKEVVRQILPLATQPCVNETIGKRSASVEPLHTHTHRVQAAKPELRGVPRYVTFLEMKLKKLCWLNVLVGTMFGARDPERLSDTTGFRLVDAHRPTTITTTAIDKGNGTWRHKERVRHILLSTMAQSAPSPHGIFCQKESAREACDLSLGSARLTSWRLASG